MNYERVEWFITPTESVAGSCERGNEPSGSTRFGEFLEDLWDY
jgi:hypothetical protein